MRSRRNSDTGIDDPENIVKVVRDPAGETSDRFHLLGLMKLVLGPFLRCDIARNRRCTHNFISRIAQGRYGNRNIELAAVLGYAHRFISADGFAAGNFSQNFGNFILAISRGKNRDLLSDDLLWRVAINVLGSLVPTGDDALEVLP